MKILKNILAVVVPFLAVSAVLFLGKKFIVTPMSVDGQSMNPNLVNKEHVLVFKTAPIHRGSVIVFSAEGVDPTNVGDRKYVKRVIGLPGDTVASSQGVIYVNNRPIKQDYISKKQRTKGTGDWTFRSLAKQHNWLDNRHAVRVPENEYFCLGDNRTVSNDSRYFGFVPKSKIVGVAKSPFYASTSDAKRSNINRQWRKFWEVETTDDNR